MHAVGRNNTTRRTGLPGVTYLTQAGVLSDASPPWGGGLEYASDIPVQFPSVLRDRPRGRAGLG